MSNHSFDCDFCGNDRRNSSFCCNQAMIYDRKQQRKKEGLESELERFEYLFGIDTDEKKLKFFKYLYSNLSKLPKQYGKRVRDIGRQEAKEAACSHKYKNGKSAWECLGGFIYANFKCKICGKTEWE